MAVAAPARRRVLIIVENLPVPFDRRVWSEATTLRAAGYAVTVICPRGRNAQAWHETIDGVDIYRHPLPREGRGALGYLVEYTAALFWESLLTWRVLLGHGFDVLHACNPPDLIFLIGGFFKYLLGKRFVFDHHDINPELYEAKFGRRGPGWRLMLLLERLTFRVADISIAPNESYRRIAIARGGMAADKVHVVRSGPDLARIRQVPAEPKWRNGRRFMVGYVGVIGRQEGIDLLIEAVRHLVEDRGRDDIQFVIVGAGPALADMRRLAARLGLADCITFTGRVDDATLFGVLSTADICVNPDRPNPMNDMSTMNKIMEYMALAKPIVQFDLTEGRVSAGEASLYAANTVPADLGDKIAELLADPDRRAVMGARGRERVLAELAWEHEAPKLLHAYERLFAESPGEADRGRIPEGASP
jgi:glycosyltransferase involved in cell wall biosynthesis